MAGIGLSTGVIGAVETSKVSREALVDVGTRVIGDDAKEYMYVVAGADIVTAAYPVLVAIDNAGTAVVATNALTLAKKYVYGVTPTVAAGDGAIGTAGIRSGDYFWAVVQGSASCKAGLGVVSVNKYLRVGAATAGRVQTVSTASATKQILGIVANASKASAASASALSNVITVVLVNPHAAA